MSRDPRHSDVKTKPSTIYHDVICNRVSKDVSKWCAPARLVVSWHLKDVAPQGLCSLQCVYRPLAFPLFWV
jgi:hypothetical protein